MVLTGMWCSTTEYRLWRYRWWN